MRKLYHISLEEYKLIRDGKMEGWRFIETDPRHHSLQKFDPDTGETIEELPFCIE